jgi:hypothetical protein
MERLKMNVSGVFLMELTECHFAYLFGSLMASLPLLFCCDYEAGHPVLVSLCPEGSKTE